MRGASIKLPGSRQSRFSQSMTVGFWPSYIWITRSSPHPPSSLLCHSLSFSHSSTHAPFVPHAFSFPLNIFLVLSHSTPLSLPHSLSFTLAYSLSSILSHYLPSYLFLDHLFIIFHTFSFHSYSHYHLQSRTHSISTRSPTHTLFFAQSPLVHSLTYSITIRLLTLTHSINTRTPTHTLTQSLFVHPLTTPSLAQSLSVHSLSLIQSLFISILFH